jgi:pantoate--beta-alanine ligase
MRIYNMRNFAAAFKYIFCKKMIVANTRAQLSSALASRNGASIGFVPTMGALHQGHISLIQEARKHCGTVVASIFVNPIQFNDKSDYEAYPVQMDADFRMLQEAGCNIVFAPSKEEIYPSEPNEKYSFGPMEDVMEGKCRPGHFNGVAVVVNRLFGCVNPDKAFFGEKDFQQLAIIKELVLQTKAAIEIVPCPTVREPDGLAMSSRNQRLQPDQRKSSLRISEALDMAVKGTLGHTVAEIEKAACLHISADPELSLEYFQIVDKASLQPLEPASNPCGAIACTAVFAGKIRLIDNMSFPHQWQN